MRSRIDSVPLNLVIRMPAGSSGGGLEHHQESPESCIASIPGINLMYVRSAQDGYSMLRYAIDSAVPTIFLESKADYWKKSLVEENANIYAPSVRKICNGADILFLGWGPSIDKLIEAAKVLKISSNIECSVVDIRFLNPIDWKGIAECVHFSKKTIIVHEGSNFASLAGYLAWKIGSLGIQKDAPIVVGSPDFPLPPARKFDLFIPSVSTIVQTALSSI